MMHSAKCVCVGLAVSSVVGMVCSIFAAEFKSATEIRYPTRYETRIQTVDFGLGQMGNQWTHIVVTPAGFVTREVGVSMNASARAGPQLGTGIQLATFERKRLDDTTDLMLVATAGDVARTRQWIKAGANVNAMNRQGSTALMGAAAGGFTDVVKVLLDNKANVRVRSQNGITPVLAAARNGHAQVVHMLLEKGAPVDAVDNYGQTALMYAVKGNHKDMAQVMVEHGADVNRMDGAGRTPVQVASDLKNQELVILLTQPAKANELRHPASPANAGSTYR
ncbi:MAG: ankyrin repeat domain-containing protein [Verrucomicrobia bacterium]|nr:ankyrin repeat domain-containing protein [Verrucomicrobiota bacterium]